MTNYVNRLTKLEEIADSFRGVSKTYVIQAGREIRCIVEPENISDAQSRGACPADFAEDTGRDGVSGSNQGDRDQGEQVYGICKMKILFIGDIFGTTGKRVVAERLPAIIEERSIDVCIANAENIAGGRGITHNLLKKLHKFGVRIITGGNHSLACPDSYDDFAADPFLLRPLNMPPGNVGHGTALFSLPDGHVLGVISLLGRTFFSGTVRLPLSDGSGRYKRNDGRNPLHYRGFPRGGDQRKKGNGPVS